MPNGKILKKVAIVGGGMSAISAATFLKKEIPDLHIEIFEKTDRLGGWVQSLNKEFFFERGPRTLSFARSRYFLELIHALGLENAILPASSTSKRYLYNGKSLLSLPPTFLSFCKYPFFYLSLLQAIFLEPFVKPKSEEETIDEFFKRRFGKNVGSFFAKAIAKGVFGGDCTTLSMDASFPKIKQLEMEGSLVKGILKQKSGGKKGLFTLKEGLGSISQAFQEKTDAQIHLEREVTSLHPISDQGKTSFLLKGINANHAHFETSFDGVILTLPPKELFKVLSISSLEIDPQITQDLAKVVAESLTLVCMGFKEAFLLPKGFGFLSLCEDPVLGAVFDSEIFPKQNETRLTWMLSGIYSEEEAKRIALSALKTILKIRKVPSFIHIEVARDAIPQYPKGHAKHFEAFISELKKYGSLFYVGMLGNGISLEDGARKGKEVAKQLGIFLKERQLTDGFESGEDLQTHNLNF